MMVLVFHIMVDYVYLSYVLQYVNHAYERLTGYSSEEILGNVNDVKDLPRNEKNKMDTQDTIRSQLRKGKVGATTDVQDTVTFKAGHVHIARGNSLSPVGYEQLLLITEQ